MKKISFVFFALALAWNSTWAQYAIHDPSREYDVVSDNDTCYLFSDFKPCFNPCPHVWAPRVRMLQEYVVADTVTVYGVAIPLRNTIDNPILDNITFYKALLMKKLGMQDENGYSFQYIDSVTLNRSHPRFCWFHYEDSCKHELTAPCYEFYFDTPKQINRMTDTFYVGRYYQIILGPSDYSLQEFGAEYDPSLPGTIWQSPTYQPYGEEIYYPSGGYYNKRWGVAFPIIGFRCGHIQNLFLDSYTVDSAVVRWRQVEEGTLYNVRLTGEDGSDTSYVTSDTTATFTPLSDSIRYTAMVRKLCHYATTNYDTTVCGEWRTVSFGTTIIPDTAVTSGFDPDDTAQPETGDFLLVPNPTWGEVLLTAGVDMTGVEVYTAAGVPFMHLTVAGRSVRLDTTTWPAGTYLLAISTRHGTVTRKLLLR